MPRSIERQSLCIPSLPASLRLIAVVHLFRRTSLLTNCPPWRPGTVPVAAEQQTFTTLVRRRPQHSTATRAESRLARPPAQTLSRVPSSATSVTKFPEILWSHSVGTYSAGRACTGEQTANGFCELSKNFQDCVSSTQGTVPAGGFRFRRGASPVLSARRV